MPAGNRRRRRRGVQSRLRHNIRRRELIAARRVQLAQETGPLIDLTLASPPAPVDLTLDSPRAPIDSTTAGAGAVPSIIDLTVGGSPEPSTSRGPSAQIPVLPSSPHASPLSISYSPISHASEQTPQPFARRQLVFSSSPAQTTTSSVDSRVTTPEYYRPYIDPPVSPPSPQQQLDPPDSDEEWPHQQIYPNYPGYYPVFISDRFPGQPNVPEGEPVPEEYHTLLFQTIFLREE